MPDGDCRWWYDRGGEDCCGGGVSRGRWRGGIRLDLVVLNVGTTGALRDGLSGLYLPSTVINHDVNAEAIRAIGLDPQEELHVEGGDGTVLASGDVFVTDPVVRARLAERAHLVDMEAYGVVYACREYGVPVRVVKHVSDSADEAALDWPALVDASAKVLGEWVSEYVRLSQSSTAVSRASQRMTPTPPASTARLAASASSTVTQLRRELQLGLVALQLLRRRPAIPPEQAK